MQGKQEGESRWQQTEEGQERHLTVFLLHESFNVETSKWIKERPDPNSVGSAYLFGK